MTEKAKSAAPVSITSFQHEDRVFPPSEEFSTKAHLKSMREYRRLYKESIDDPEAFWGKMAEKELVWFRPWKQVLKWKVPDAKWFIGGKLNLSVNCLDRHLDTATANKSGHHLGRRTGWTWQGRRRTDAHLPAVAPGGLPFRECSQTKWRRERRPRHHLSADGARSGRRHAGLRAHRRGAFVVFRRFQRAIGCRPNFDCQAKLVITADGGFRGARSFR
jgi:acetyl-CoA synthetase